ncbi:MAG: DUF624 domain-containing protein [Lachnospiraceae bacterium]|nr:DUF624 domain-containing protein [Lachnospiraceae bacterium]
MGSDAKAGGAVTGIITVIAELAQLNLLTLLFCLPIITAGASLTAMHAVLIAMVRNEEGYIGRMFIKAFRENLKQATLLWLPFLMIFLAAGVDFMIAAIDGSLLPVPVVMAVFVVAVITYLLMQFVFPLQAHFESSVRNTLTHAAILAAAYFPKTFIMAVLGLLPWYIGVKIIFLLPLTLIFGFSIPGFMSAKLYNSIFIRLEESSV